MLKEKKKGIFARAICLVLVALMLGAMLCSCAPDKEEVKDPILSYGEHEIPLGLYELMLSRMKGTLARNKYDVTVTSDFWTNIHPATDDVTNQDYYNKIILDNCRNYLAALVIFEKEGLSLSDSVLASIDEEIQFYIDYDADGSVEKFDKILADYGTNSEELRQIYIIEAKYQAVISWLYGSNASKIADNVKEDYYQENYYRFKQILVSNFYYEFQIDEHGNTIYFSSETGLPIYDEKGKYKYDENGNRLKDSFGAEIRFGENGEWLYDTKNGYPAPTTDDKGEAIKHYYSKEEMEKRYLEAQKIVESADGGNYHALESQMKDWELYEGAINYYTDGYYLSDIESSSYGEYLCDILDNLKDMEVGEARLVESESGYHVVVRYELDKGKYTNSEYSVWFENFNQSLITKFFLDKCSDFYDDIKMNDENLEKAESMKYIGINYNY